MRKHYYPVIEEKKYDDKLCGVYILEKKFKFCVLFDCYGYVTMLETDRKIKRVVRSESFLLGYKI